MSATSSYVCVIAVVLALGGLGCGVSSDLVTPQADAPVVDAGGGGGKPVDAGSPPVVRDAGLDAGMEPAVMVRPPCGSGLGCDPTDLGGESCHSLGLGSGTLLCDPATCTFEVSLCTAVSGRVPCGSGPNCDPTNLGRETCESLGMGPGTLTCDPVSCTFDTALCTEPPTGTGGTGAGGTGGGLFGGGFFGGGMGGSGGTGGTGGMPDDAGTDSDAGL